MNVYKLIAEHENNNPSSHCFDRETLKFFGERISEMRVLKNTVKIKDINGEEHTAYVLSSLQRNHPVKPTRRYHYFDTVTFEFLVI